MRSVVRRRLRFTVFPNERASRIPRMNWFGNISVHKRELEAETPRHSARRFFPLLLFISRSSSSNLRRINDGGPASGRAQRRSVETHTHARSSFTKQQQFTCCWRQCCSPVGNLGIGSCEETSQRAALDTPVAVS